MTIEQLIAASYGQPAADVYRAFEFTDEVRQIAAEVGLEILRRHPPTPGACAMMGAVYAQGLRQRLNGPIHLVAGKLDVDGVRVFGRAGSVSGSMPFMRSDPDWDGHMWVMIGDHIADVSLLRTGRASGGPPALKRMMAREFGKRDVALLIVAVADAVLSGLEYLPEYVLTQEEIEGLERGAEAILPLT